MQRHRVMGAYGSVPYKDISWTTPNPKPAGTVVNVPNAVGSVVTMDDFVTPGFKKLQARGSIICSPMHRISDSRSSGTGVLLMTLLPRATAPVRVETTYHEITGINPASGYVLDLGALAGRSIPDYSRMLSEARTRALANVARPDFAGLVSLGELSESLRYLRNPFKQALKLANALEWRIGRLYREEKKRPRLFGLPDKGTKRGRLNPDDAKIIKELEGIYLEFRYGVRPMIQEVTSALENIRERAVPKPKRQTFRAKQQQVDKDSWSVNTSTGSISHTESYVYERTVSTNVGLLYEFTSDFGIGDKWGLQLGQVPIALWQLASLSFIVDWGLNVGQFISALTPVPGANRLCEWVSTRISHKLTRSYSGWYETGWDSFQTATGGKSPDSLIIEEYSRVPFVGLPDLVFKQNAVETFSEAARILDLITIFHQKLANALSMGKEVSSSITRRTGRPHSASKWFG